MQFVYRTVPLWEKGEKTEKQPVAVYDVSGGITAIARDPRNTAGKTYQFVGYERVHLYKFIAVIIVFAKCEYFVCLGRNVINCLNYLTGSIEYGYAIQSRMATKGYT